MFDMDGLLPGLKAPPSGMKGTISIEEEPPKKGLSRAWDVLKMLYHNEVTR